MSSKKDVGRIPLVLSIICEGKMNEPGDISSRKEPTAENAMIAQTPRDLRADMLAREGTAEGESDSTFPWCHCVGVRKKNLTLPRKAVDTYENIIY